MVANHIISVKDVSSGTAVGHVRARVSPGANASIKCRVEMLEKEIADHFNEIGELRSGLQNAERGFKESADREKAARDTGDKEVRDLLTKAVVGEIHIEWYALLYFLTGIILASASPEIGAALCFR